MELQGENPFRCGAYYKAARAISQLETNLGDVVAAGTLHEIPGIGSTLKEKITLLVSMVSRLRAEQARADDENARLTQEIDTLRARRSAGSHPQALSS